MNYSSFVFIKSSLRTISHAAGERPSVVIVLGVFNLEAVNCTIDCEVHTDSQAPLPHVLMPHNENNP